MAERRDPLDDLHAGLADLDAAGLTRRRRIVTTPCRPEAGLADRSTPVLELLDFLERLAPFSSPSLILRDTAPRLRK